MLRIRIFWGLCWILWTPSRWGISCVPHVGKPYFAHPQSRLHHYCRGKPYVVFWNALNIEAELEECLWNVISLTELLLFLFWCFEMTVILQYCQSSQKPSLTLKAAKIWLFSNRFPTQYPYDLWALLQILRSVIDMPEKQTSIKKRMNYGYYNIIFVV